MNTEKYFANKKEWLHNLKIPVIEVYLSLMEKLDEVKSTFSSLVIMKWAEEKKIGKEKARALGCCCIMQL